MRTLVRLRRLALASAIPALLLAWAMPSQAADEAPVRHAGSPDAVDGSYLVVLKDGGSATRVASRHGAKLVHTYRSALSGFAAEMSARQARQVAADPAVAYVEQDQFVRIATDQTNPPSWGLDRIDQRRLPLNARYNYDTTATTVRVYVIDTGIRIGHEDFGGRASYGWDTVNEDGVASDCHGHGTHVAGTIGGGRHGVAKGVRLIAMKALNCQGQGTTSNIVQAIDWVTAHHVKPAVVNMSLGGGGNDSIDDAVRGSIGRGITHAVAAGNNNGDACAKSPARVSQAITVGATDRDDRRSSFSNWGRCVDLFAPGRDIVSAHHTSNTATRSMSGTSMASPHVAGAAALYLAKHSTATPAQVSSHLKTNATRGVVGGPGTGSPNLLLYRTRGSVIRSLTCSGTTGSFSCTMTRSAGTPSSIRWYQNGAYVSGWDYRSSVTGSCPSGPVIPGGYVPVNIRVLITDTPGGSIDQRTAIALCKPAA